MQTIMIFLGEIPLKKKEIPKLIKAVRRMPPLMIRERLEIEYPFASNQTDL